MINEFDSWFTSQKVGWRC